METEQQVPRYLGGLRQSIQDALILFSFWTIQEPYQRAMVTEKQQSQRSAITPRAYLNPRGKRHVQMFNGIMLQILWVNLLARGQIRSHKQVTLTFVVLNVGKQVTWRTFIRRLTVVQGSNFWSIVMSCLILNRLHNQHTTKKIMGMTTVCCLEMLVNPSLSKKVLLFQDKRMKIGCELIYLILAAPSRTKSTRWSWIVEIVRTSFLKQSQN